MTETSSSKVIDLFPYARDKAMLEVEKKRIELYHLISVIMMYNRTEDDRAGWMFIKPLYRFVLAKRMEAISEEKKKSGQVTGEVIPFPQRMELIEDGRNSPERV